jgi:hypothetical protein
VSGAREALGDVDTDERADARRARRRSQTRTAIISTTVIAVVLAIAFFPTFFSSLPDYDDEGSYLVIMREFLKHGSLYRHTGSAYGPFYFSFIGGIYSLIGQQPTPFNARVIALLMTSAESAFLAATVFRVTRSKLAAALCQVAAFCLLIQIVGPQALHPSLTIVLLLSILAYALASYAMDKRPALLGVAGVMVGALTLTKVNIGVLAAAAVIVGWVIGNERCGKVLQVLVGAGALILPFVIAFKRLDQLAPVMFVALVSLSLLLVYAPLWVDRITFPARALVPAVWGLIGALIASVVWPLVRGTPPASLFRGVLIAPLGQVETLELPARVQFGWVAIIVTMAGAYAALARNKHDGEPTLFGSPLLPHVALVLAGLWVFGLGLSGTFGAWLPAIALIPALAWISGAPPKTRRALRFLVPLAILQILHAYPVAGAQKQWGSVLLFVPCAIAIATGLQRISAWTKAGVAARTLAVGALCLVVALTLGQWPGTIWRDYTYDPPLGLAGTRLMRVDRPVALNLRRLTEVVRNNCDTFYSAPGFDSLYIYTGLEPPTGLLRNWPGAHKASEQREIASDLAAAEAAGKRVCIVRNLPKMSSWQASSYGDGPLGLALARYQRNIATVGRYEVSVQGGAP